MKLVEKIHEFSPSQKCKIIKKWRFGQSFMSFCLPDGDKLSSALKIYCNYGAKNGLVFNLQDCE